MFELLFLCGLFALLIGTIWEYLSALPCFPTIITAAFAIPLFAWSDYLAIVQRLSLDGLDTNRAPVPPERFYWTLHKRTLRSMLIWSTPVSIAAWGAAVHWPAEFAWSRSSAIGWIAGALAVFATSRVCAASYLYLRASQWFDKMSPWAVGACRRWLYRVSENPDFLDATTEAEREKEKTVY